MLEFNANSVVQRVIIDALMAFLEAGNVSDLWELSHLGFSAAEHVWLSSFDHIKELVKSHCGGAASPEKGSWQEVDQSNNANLPPVRTSFMIFVFPIVVWPETTKPVTVDRVDSQCYRKEEEYKAASPNWPREFPEDKFIHSLDFQIDGLVLEFLVEFFRTGRMSARPFLLTIIFILNHRRATLHICSAGTPDFIVNA